MKVLIVDDEPIARRGLRQQLERMPGVTCTGECDSRDKAVAAIVEQRPDVVLLDIQLRRATAFEIIEDIGADMMPIVIFVTAYDRHAFKAFEVHALDYVLKPVDPVRLQEAIERAASMLALKRGASLADRLEGLLERTGDAPLRGASDARVASPERVVVRDADRLLLLDLAAIEWFESAGNYVRSHSGGRAYLMRTTMDRMAQRLAANADFIRVRRSAMINIRMIIALERFAKSAFVIHLRSGTKVISSRYYLPAVRHLVRSSLGR